MPAPSSLRGSALSTTEVSPPEEYFRGVSTLCRRMLDDMSAVKESFGDSWDKLSYQQQCRVIDQAIVDEATVRRYDHGGAAGPECEYFPKLKLPTGQKVVCDENLTARGISCTWRDEHSAPFSWHTRSQMDLTLDTPPDTPTHPSTPVEPPPTSIEGEGRVIPGGRAVYTARPVSLPRPPRFRWHYDPPDVPPESPSIVVAAPKSATLPSNLNRGPQKSSPGTKYMLVRGKGSDNEGGGGFMSRIKGVVAALTATCLPLRPSQGPTSHLSIHNPSEGGGEPELRPLHVQAQAAKIIPSGQAQNPTGAEITHKQSNIPSLAPHKSCPPPLANVIADPSLSGYVCSLPEDDDDIPYTMVNPSSQSRISPHGQLPPTFHTSTVNMTQASETMTTQTTMASHDHAFPDSSACAVGFGLTTYMSPTASLPTPMPTPTTGNPDNPMENFTPMCSSTPAPSAQQQQYNLPRPVLQQPDLISDTLDSRSADIGYMEARKSLFVEGNKAAEARDQADEMMTSIMSTKSESAIPKTGFDFLDNW